MGGRKPLTKKQKQIQGTSKKCREKDTVDLVPVTKIPPPPGYMSYYGKKIYKDVTRELEAKKLLQVVGLPLVVSYSHLMAQHIEAEKKLMKEGKTIGVETKRGSFMVVHPLHRVSMDALEKAIKIASEFGLTLASQSRIAAPFVKGKNPADDDFTH